MLSLIFEHFWLKLSNPLPIQSYELSWRVLWSENLQANQKTRQSQFSSLEREAGVQLTPQS